ncbi:Scr1 family TA system antitoxin-like transcriptional regulator [Micromonospora sp. WMMD998]|uniref:Scr1 family TA system antitoxin-like transcriptional regulator n=1 Tax=Micromonospora sp. WMMD998 TaxID=3016092 RepID=UPI00249A665B|nr:Scr1 family TA system antitoxin-like transcriptional regulator [Micromonospora sp. WMMD998]WFE37712.1 Scr1 family TA system antitoxin-like transcriptional regulator [Micromonospora sp. WMMD998]
MRKRPSPSWAGASRWVFSLRNLPCQGVGAYAGLDGPFVVATRADLVDVGYLDNRLRGQVVERADEVAALREQWEAILAEALTLQQSTELITEVAKSWT